MRTLDRYDYRDVANGKIASRLKQVLTLLVAIVIGMIISIGVNAQGDFHKNKARHFKSKFRTQKHQYANACDLLDKKRSLRPKANPKLSAGNKWKYKPMAEIDPPGTTAQLTKPKPTRAAVTETLKPVAVAQMGEIPTEEKLEQLHKNEDVVLTKNHLPAPTSEKHNEIRKLVSETLKNKKDNEPVDLAPLYFNFDQDEFSVVDMDPFLIAVEYALQGRTILIEGHTDNNGKDSYNVDLSIKRVQKIRQLMHEMGVPDDRISVIGYGEEVAKHDNTSENGRQLNRRVDFKAF
jgi:outer membrane protein OmpA-like peptidoglycan-associated protein